LFLSGQMSAIEARLQDAETVLAGYAASGNNAQVAELFGEIATLRAYLFRVQGDPVRGIELAQQVLEQVPEDNLAARGVLHTVLGGLFNDVGDITRASQSYAEAVPICQAAGNIMAAMMAAELLVQLLMMQGQLQRAAEVCRHMQEDIDGTDAGGKRREPTSDLVCVSIGNVLYEWNELHDAEAYVRKGIEQGKRGGFFQALVFGQILLARVLQARGDADGATNTLQEAAKSALMNPPRWYRAELVACQVQLWLAQGNLAAASRWAQESDLSADTEFNQLNEFEHITLARVLIAQGRAESDGTTLSKALGLLERLSLALAGSTADPRGWSTER
jgi:LuxR family maltose regulon positive regulatory protein